MSLIEIKIAAIFIAAAISAVMASAWYVQRRTGNSGWVDVTWSLGVGGLASIAAAWPLRTGLAALAANDRCDPCRILVPAAGWSHCRTHSRGA